MRTAACRRMNNQSVLRNEVRFKTILRTLLTLKEVNAQKIDPVILPRTREAISSLRNNSVSTKV
jgi:hypothetical protein